MLVEIRSYLSQRRRASLDDLANHFDMPPDAMRPMLEHWVRKGKAARHAVTDGCSSGCGKCAESVGEIYEWLDV
uniref:FeoC like transcriptional regulator n=1 Tax=Candidatus Kentrum sp. FM TaxID=2126340 RepID=A0A450SW60_9GAMM|nr:MAG: FeoC like transcriptional regulator [Candidatus Kentron sp. FM]VFJ68068.1 MAG: FeoC like transcriptional regulator [Candidatus Kentron sp. FM]VFK13860.1 MAG: FeoC like transcriptional regulator [Candidatus Kentron sp. FM]